MYKGPLAETIAQSPEAIGPDASEFWMLEDDAEAWLAVALPEALAEELEPEPWPADAED